MSSEYANIDRYFDMPGDENATHTLLGVVEAHDRKHDTLCVQIREVADDITGGFLNKRILDDKGFGNPEACDSHATARCFETILTMDESDVGNGEKARMIGMIVADDQRRLLQSVAKALDLELPQNSEHTNDLATAVTDSVRTLLCGDRLRAIDSTEFADLSDEMAKYVVDGSIFIARTALCKYLSDTTE